MIKLKSLKAVGFLLIITLLLNVLNTSYALSNLNSSSTAELFPENEVIDVRLTINQTDYESIINNAEKEEFKIADVLYNGINVKDIGVRAKGNSSLKMVTAANSERYSYKLDFSQFIDNQSLQGVTSISLNNNFSDPTYMREFLSYELFEKLNVPVPRHCYANLYINDRLIGLYLAVENINDEYIKNSLNLDDATLYKPDGVGCDLAYHGNSIKDYPGLVDKSDNNTGNHYKVLEMIDELNNGTNYDKYLNVDEILRYLAVSTVLSNFDSYQGLSQHNYYLYDNNGVFSIIPWDLNMSFGSFSMGTDYTKMASVLIDEPTQGKISGWPLIEKLLNIPSNKEKYHSYIQQLVDGPLSNEAFEDWIAEIKALITPHIKNQSITFFSYEEFEKSFYEDLKTDVGVIQGLITFTKARVNHIKSQLEGTEAAYISGDGLNAKMPPRGKGNPPILQGQRVNASPENTQKQPPDSNTNTQQQPGKKSAQSMPAAFGRLDLPELIKNIIGITFLLILVLYLRIRDRQ